MKQRSTILLGGIATLALGTLAHADLAGFSTFTDNGGATNTPTDLTITTAAGGEATSAYSTIGQNYTNGFTASFTYTPSAAGGSGEADGFTFILQNVGQTAVGGAGGAVGYDNIGAPSAAVVGHNFNGSNVNFGTGGKESTVAGGGDTTPSGVSFDNLGVPVNATITYNPSSGVTETLTQVNGGVTNTYTTSYATGDLSTVVGGTTALVGFTGGTGGGFVKQDITNFSYTASAVPEPSTWVAAGGLLLLAAGDFRRRLKA